MNVVIDAEERLFVREDSGLWVGVSCVIFEMEEVTEYHRICGEAVVANVCRVIHALNCFRISSPCWIPL
jgi:hypothetical protein